MSVHFQLFQVEFSTCVYLEWPQRVQTSTRLTKHADVSSSELTHIRTSDPAGGYSDEQFVHIMSIHMCVRMTELLLQACCALQALLFQWSLSALNSSFTVLTKVTTNSQIHINRKIETVNQVHFTVILCKFILNFLSNITDRQINQPADWVKKQRCQSSEVKLCFALLSLFLILFLNHFTVFVSTSQAIGWKVNFDVSNIVWSLEPTEHCYQFHRGQDGLLCKETSRRPGSQQVQYAQVPADCTIHQ